MLARSQLHHRFSSERARPDDSRRVLSSRRLSRIAAVRRLRIGSPRLAITIDQAKARTASRAAKGLGVKSAIGRIVILARAVAHIGNSAIVVARAIVGNVANDRESRAAVGAVGERIAKRRSGGSKISRRQSSQVAMSGEIKTCAVANAVAGENREREFARDRIGLASIRYV